MCESQKAEGMNIHDAHESSTAHNTNETTSNRDMIERQWFKSRRPTGATKLTKAIPRAKSTKIRAMQDTKTERRLIPSHRTWIYGQRGRDMTIVSIARDKKHIVHTAHMCVVRPLHFI
jgi:hypothetical protein